MEEQPYDERHAPRPAHLYPTLGQDPSTELPPARFFEAEQIPWTPGNGLTWVDSATGWTMVDLGRLTKENVQHVSMLDLRVILAHLDSAATAIKAELEER